MNGGQGLGRLSDQRVVFVWNALPGETVKVRLIKSKRSYAEAVAEEIVEASADRVEPKEAEFLATSPWQILSQQAEREAKLSITRELFQSNGTDLPEVRFHQSPNQWHYRNKMEYSFWGDELGLHLALHQRGSRLKQPVSGSALAQQPIDRAAAQIVVALRDVWAGKLKSLVLRSTRLGEVAASLYVTDETVPALDLDLPPTVQGMKVYFSNPKSPASVPTRLLKTYGQPKLTDEIRGRCFSYDSDAFFQVNLPVFEMALAAIRGEILSDSVVDMYAGVGSIGLSLDTKAVQLVEINETAAAFAALNAQRLGILADIRAVGAEAALELIPSDQSIVFDPPRAGLSRRIIERLRQKLPPKVIYLSCNPATLARDVGLLQAKYELKTLDVFNFFPKTPHTEALAILVRRA